MNHLTENYAPGYGRFLMVYDAVSLIFSSIRSVTYIRVTGNSKEIPILNSNCSVVLLTQVIEGESISFIYTIRLFSRFCNTQRNFSIVYQNF